MRLVEREQRLLVPPHRPHRVGQHQRRVAAIERVSKHRDHLGVHEGLAAREAYFPGRQSLPHDLVEKSRGVSGGEINQRIIGRRALDIAGRAGEIAERAGVDPQCVERHQRHLRPRLARGGDLGIGELGGRQRPDALDPERRRAGRRIA